MALLAIAILTFGGNVFAQGGTTVQPAVKTANLCAMGLCSFTGPRTVEQVFKVIMTFLGLTITLVSVLGIIIGGLFYIFSFGNPSGAEKGKVMIIASLTGLTFVFLSYLIVTLVQSFIYGFGT